MKGVCTFVVDVLDFEGDVVFYGTGVVGGVGRWIGVMVGGVVVVGGEESESGAS